MKTLVSAQGYQYFAVVDQPTVIDDFIYKRPVVAIASRYPITEVIAIEPNLELAKIIGLADDFSFSRKILRATIDVPHLGACDCYVVHFKSKRSMLEVELRETTLTSEKTIIEHLKAQVAGGWGATLQRGSEAALLMIEMINRREESSLPMVLMGDFNQSLADDALSHLLTNTLNFVSTFDRDAYLEKYCLQDAWDLFQSVQTNEVEGLKKCDVGHTTSLNNNIDKAKLNNETACAINKKRKATHYYGASGTVLDYILLSCEFDASYHDSLYQINDYHTYDQHLISPIFERDGQSTDHAVVLISLTLRS